MYSFSQGKNNLMVFDCYPNRMLFIVVFLLFCHIVCSISSDNLSDKPLTFIKTIGGTGSSAVTNDGYAASTAAIGSPSMMWLDTVGNLFISQPTFHRIRRIDANDSRIHTFIGTGVAGLNNENGPISSTQLYSPMGIWGDSLGNYMYVAENNNHRIRRVDIRSKTIETIAGYGYIGYSGFKGDKGPATMSWLSSPYSVAIDTLGNLYVSDYSNSRIRKLTRPHAVTYSVTSSNNVTTESIVWPDDYAFNYTITTVAGTTSSGYYRDNITATSSQAYLSYPLFSTVDRNGNILIADSSNHRIRVVVASTNKIFTIAGTGNTNYNGDGMLATVTNLYTPTSLWLSHPFDTSAESILYLYDGYHYRVRAFAYNPDNPMESVVNASIMMNIAGAGYSGHFDISMEYGKNPLNVPLGFSRGIAGDPIESRYLYVSDQSYHIIWKIDLWIKLIFPYAGTSGTANYGGDGGLAYAAYFNSPNGLWVDSIGDVYVADTNNHRIRKITNFESITNSSTNETTITSIVSTIAGIGLAGLIGDGGDAKLSRLYSPFGVTGDHRGNIYVADSTNHRVRIISAPVPVYDPSSGSTTNVSIIKTIAGSGQYGLSGFNGDNLRGTSTMLWFPYAVFGDSAGDSLYFTDRSNYRIRKLDLISGIVATVAGNSSSWGYIIDNVPALKSKVYPSGLWLDPTTGDIYYTDTILHRVRKIVRSTGLIQNIAGTANEYGYNSEDGQLAINAHLYNPLSVWGDTVGNIWVADSTNGRVRKIDKQTGIIYTALGTGLSGLAGFNGDKALASMAYLSAPYSIVLQSETDDKLSFLFADLNNYRIRRLSMTKTNVDSMLTNTSSFSITTIAGTGVNSMSGDGAAATSTTIYAMFSIYESPLTNDLYFVEQYYYRIRKVSAVTNEVTTVIGTGIYGFSGDGTPVSSANLMYPVALWIHPNNTLYFSDSSAYRVRYFDLNNVTFNNVTMKETLESFLYTLIGDGTSGNSGDGGFASHAQIGTIRGMYGNDKYLWISDYSYHVIRKVDLQTNIVTRVAGSGNAGYNGDNQPATSAYLYSPYGIWVNSIGDLFIADSNNHRIRKVEAGTGLMRTIAGTGTAGLMAESGIATSLRLYTPTSVVGDRSGNIYFTDVNNHRIRMIVNSTSSVSRLRKPMLYTIAGARSVGVRTYAGDNGPISSAQLNNLFHVITDTIGNLYIADRNNHRVRKTFGLYFPTSQPTSQPSNQPISQPSRRPTSQPTSQPSSQPFCHPTSPPSAQPSEQPSKMPISAPTSQPSSQPLLLPTGKPSVRPVGAPTSHPSSQPSVQPSLSPTSQPSSLPTHQPFALPSTQPTNSPTNQPSHQPSAAPSIIPSNIPSSQPSASPTSIPSRCPSSLPTVQPTHQPSLQPSSQPSHQPTDEPSSSPTSQPSFQPSSQPTNQPSCQPSFHPSSQPTQSPTARPSKQPSSEPTHQPTRSPSHQPTSQPSEKPSHQPSSQPSSQPLRAPTCQPSGQPSWRPSSQPSVEPSKQPISIPSNQPTSQPSMEPSKQPISIPSNQPTSQPLSKPSAQPSRRPTAHPTCQPSNQPSRFPSANPSKRPSSQPSSCPTSKPSTPPTSVPTPKPTPGPSFAPTIPPTVKPSMQPQATFGPTLRPTTAVPSEIPSALPSILPTVIPTQASKLELLSATMNGLGNIVTVSMKLHGSLDTIFSKNNTAGSFVCSAMLTFTDSNIATCVVNFQSSINSFITISISVPSGSSFHVGEVIGYQYSYAVVERSEAVPSSSQPSVSGIVPAALPACSNLNMDFSSTSGQLSGKQWYNVSISIIASQNQTQADVITSYLSATYFPFSTKFFKQPVSVPSIYLLPGVEEEEEDTYTISIQVCNILLLCDAKSFVFYTSSTLTSSPPITSIAGNSVRSITRATGLTLYSTLYVPLCGTEKRTSGLIAQWSVFEIKDNVKVLTSSYNSTSSSSGSKLYLAPNTLPSNSRYVIELAGFDTVTKLKSQIVSAVVINVAASSLVVSLSPLSITGGKTQLLRVGNNLVVDASTSFDPDDVNPGSSTSALRFTWYCRWSNSPLCPLSMNRITINGINDVGLRLTANSTAFNTTSLIILTVSAGVTGRNSSISFMVQVIGAEAPLISFTTPASSVSNVNTANRLTLLASVQTLSSCSAIWSVNDSSIMIEMRSSAYALTPLSVFVSGSSSVNLVLSGNLLQAGSNYVFSLTCGGSTGKIVVTTNNIPQSGVYMVSPSEGVELSTSFSFTTSQWVDSDLPLSYQFSFVSPTSATDMTIRGKSELTTTSSTLPSGSASQGFGLNTTATVYDVLGASNRLVQRVLVTMLSTAEVQSRLTDQLSVLSFSSSSSSDAVSAEDITNLIAIASTAMNRVDCSGAPVCNTLYRAECQSTSATCGSCLLGYVGEAGDANSACISEAILLQAVSSPSSSSSGERTTCKKDSDCLGWQRCSSVQYCEDRNKTCLNDCNSALSQGQCHFYAGVTPSTKRLLSSCSMLAPSSECYAECLCRSGYDGEDCSMTAKALEGNQNLRAKLLDGLSLVVSSDGNDVGVSASSVSSSISSFQSIIRNDFDLPSPSKSGSGLASADVLSTSLEIVSGIFNQAFSVIDGSGTSSLSYQSTETILSPLESTVSKVLQISDNKSMTVNMIDSFVQSIDTFGDIVVSGQVAGEDAYTYIGDVFRLIHKEVQLGADGDSTDSIASLKLPRSTTEKLRGSSPPMVVSINSSSNVVNGDLYLQAIEYDASLWSQTNQSAALLVAKTLNNGTGFSSNSTSSVSVTFLSNIVQLKAPLSLSTLTITVPITTSQTSDLGQNVTFVCLTGDYDKKSFACAESGVIVEYQCTGVAGRITKYCPILAPSCRSVSWTDQTISASDADSCIVVHSTSSNITCECSLGRSARRVIRGRRLVDTSEDGILYESGVLTMVAMASYTAIGVTETFAAADDMDSLQDVEKTILIMAMFAALWSTGGLVLLVVWWKRNDDVKKEERLLEKKGIQINDLDGKEGNGSSAVAPIQVGRGRERSGAVGVKTRTVAKIQPTSELSPSASKGVIDAVKAKRVIDNLRHYIDSVVPPVYLSPSFLARLKGELLRHHSYLNVFFGLENSSDYSSRGRLPWIPVFHLLTIQTMLIFLLAVLYDLQYPSSPEERQKCYSYVTKAECLKQKSLFDSSETFCQWMTVSFAASGSTSGEECIFVEPDLTLEVTLYCAVISSVFTAIVLRPLNYLFILLSAPSEEGIKASIAAASVIRKLQNQVRRASLVAMNQVNQFASILPGMNGDKKVENSGKKGHQFTARFIPPETNVAYKEAKAAVLSLAAVGSGGDDIWQTRVVKRLTQRTVLNNKQPGQAKLNAGNSFTSAVFNFDSLEESIFLQRENFVSLVKQNTIDDLVITKQRQLLKRFIQVYDRQWGLKQDVVGSHAGSQTVDTLTKVASSDIRQRKHIRIGIQGELVHVAKSAQEVIDKLHSNATDTHIGIEVIQLFIQDLLGRDTAAAKIFRSKLEEDYSHLPVVKRRVKILITILLVLINAFFIYFTLLRGFERGFKWQQSFVMGCVVQIVVEMCLYETMECLWINVFIPNLVTKEVHGICQVLRDTIDHLGKTFLTSAAPLNATKGVVANDRRGSEAKTDDDSGDLNKQSAINDNIDGFLLNVPDYLFISSRIAKEFPSLLESAIVLSYTTCLPGEMRRNWHRNTGHTTHSTGSKTTWSISGQLVQWFILATANVSAFFLYFIANVPFDIQRMFIRFVQPFIYGGMLVLWYTIESSLWLEVTFLAVCSLVVAGLIAGYYRGKAGMVVPTSSRDLGDEEDDEDDESVNIGVMDHIIEKDLNLNLLFQSTESFAQRVELNVTAKNAPALNQVKEQQHEGSSSSSSVASKSLSSDDDDSDFHDEDIQSFESLSFSGIDENSSIAQSSATMDIIYLTPEEEVEHDHTRETMLKRRTRTRSKSSRSRLSSFESMGV